MKNMNRKGFTLVELLVVLVILVVIMAIAIPSVTSSVERSKQKQKDAKIELLESGAEIYVDRHKNSFNTGNDAYIIYIKDIICDGILTKEQVKDPLNDEYTLSGYVAYTKSSSKYEFKEVNTNTYKLKISDNLTC